jgi:Protein of unknown function (DUF5132)
MLDKLWEAVTGRWGLAAVVLLAIPDGRKALKSVAKEAIRAGLVISEQAKDLMAEVKEETSDMVAEVKAERKQSHTEKHALQKN